MMIPTCVRLHLGGNPVDFEVETAMNPVTIEATLPAFRKMADQLVQIGVESAKKQGKHVTCASGCGACCRRAVPIAFPEAHRLRELVDAMPEPRRSDARARFAQAMDIFRNSAVFEDILRRIRTEEDRTRYAAALEAYYARKVACPFLEGENCSIYEERPLSCREHLVTSPPQNCANPDSAGVERLPLLARPSDALILACADEAAADSPIPAILLVQLLEWTDQNPPGGELRIGPEWLGPYCEQLVTAASNPLQPPE
jgi:Fe-S-cluster containining protein